MEKRTNWFYILIALMLVAMLFISGKYFKGSGEASIGIAQTSEYKVNTEKSALVKSVNIVPGMQVKKGDLLVELSSDALEVDIAKLTNRIAVYKSERDEKAKLANAEISYLKAQKGIEIEELDAEIMELESEIRMNEALTKAFTSDKKTSENSPISIKVRSLRQQKQKHLEAMNIKVEDVLQESTTEQHLVENQISLLESELKLLEAEKSKLNKYATASGVVKNVYVKPGEQVDSFTPLLEINPLHPTTVVAYLVGKKPTELGVGKIVSVSSYDQQRNSVEGKVIGYGSVSELPEILQKSTATKAFGQQVFIEIPVENTFFNGEKVLIR
ncbi:multidrug resistance efflux pump [Catalinimonas alkaloidigena]|uniref:HlyD family secretion protein n=1 Tax=Catalinimonas alkaloidigena TaxID=1075417 RepID=UPI002405AFA2|nr:biotin/lipoyl-binding protein [Catalinimonas alkaloidigena]MDF9799305.1 multidrug resistance efflux pump [Catalinimonas alkaloidigena]